MLAGGSNSPSGKNDDWDPEDGICGTGLDLGRLGVSHASGSDGRKAQPR